MQNNNNIIINFERNFKKLSTGLKAFTLVKKWWYYHYHLLNHFFKLLKFYKNSIKNQKIFCKYIYIYIVSFCACHYKVCHTVIIKIWKLTINFSKHNNFLLNSLLRIVFDT